MSQCRAERHTRATIYYCVLEDDHDGRHQDGGGRQFQTFVEALTREPGGSQP